MLDDFALKKPQNWEGKFVLTENQIGRNEICCAEDNHNYMSNMRKRNSQIRTLIKKLWQNIDFKEIAPNFTYLQQSSASTVYFMTVA